MFTTASAWELYNEFSANLATLSDEDWISFRGRLYELEDLIKDWQVIYTCSNAAPALD